MSSTGTPERFVDRLAARDFAGMTAMLAPGARARLLLPRGAEEEVGREAIAARIESWFGPALEFRLTSSSAERVGSRHRASWRFSVVRPGQPPEEIEQLAFLDEGRDGIERIDLLCSGFQPVAVEDEGAMRVFDAGTMGCADGLAQEFRRELGEVEVGHSLQVVVRDPAAREDLPSLARLLGQSVKSVEAHEDGRLVINVERIK